MHERMRYDDIAWERSEAQFEAWSKKFYQEDILREIGNFMAKHRGGVPKELCSPVAGAFNVCLQMKFGDGGSAIIRFPQPGNVRFPKEKLLKEVAVMRYVAENTSIPVPFVLHYGMADESPAGMGPFILTEHIRHEHNVTAALNTPGFVRKDRPILNPQIPETELKFIYSQMADVLLRLSQPSFSQIGSIGEDAEYCRRKYVARHLFRKFARDGRLSSAHSLDANPFKLFCDDLRPSNVLVDADCRVVGVIDWEFSYAAPAEFTYSPPWWLLIETPEKWPKGVSDWVKEYEPRLKTFLEELTAREDIMISDGSLAEDQRLSGRMRESWESGAFWISYVARKSWAFDMIFWEQINSRFFGDNSGYEDRVKLLSQEERDGMEEFVERKLNDAKTRDLDDWEKDEANRLTSAFIST
ncbi:uncharacterized protein BP5553_09042 [Venustampulla echinocandica]|uniref:Aminoglycoside phosphotransferase domain-containing protein n=1 Tax=Venustampulla echinocandica TaxID=2656787 RepID=A0A370TDQ2_9HELO|nr:uncharacterized protein BP5553_09042 [Venustampulla echinocandica]RDL32586.1 hypothetical protein BP5553_09042 [Venustampulla echinocandica]